MRQQRNQPGLNTYENSIRTANFNKENQVIDINQMNYMNFFGIFENRELTLHWQAFATLAGRGYAALDNEGTRHLKINDLK